MMRNKGFPDVVNLSGGIKAWLGETAIGPVEQGLELFEGRMSPKNTLLVAFSLEQGLQDFYLSMLPNITLDDVKHIFERLAQVEVKHQERVFNEYVHLVDRPISRQEFEEQTIQGIMEGGMTTEEYVDMFRPHLASAIDVISMAMSIEAQALDLYQRAAESADNPRTKHVLMDIAGEERRHLNRLGELMDGLDESS